MEVNFVVFNNLHYKMQIEILGSDYKCLTFKPVHLVKVIISLLHVTEPWFCVAVLFSELFVNL